MKRFLTYCLVAVTFFVGVTATTVFRTASIPTSHKQSLPSEHSSSFSAVDLLASSGMGNEQIRLTNLFHQVSFRVISLSSNAFRISYLLHLERQQFVTSHAAFLLRSAFKQSAGYYLYHLRKLLI